MSAGFQKEWRYDFYTSTDSLRPSVAAQVANTWCSQAICVHFKLISLSLRAVLGSQYNWLKFPHPPCTQTHTPSQPRSTSSAMVIQGLQSICMTHLYLPKFELGLKVHCCSTLYKFGQRFNNICPVLHKNFSALKGPLSFASHISLHSNPWQLLFFFLCT